MKLRGTINGIPLPECEYRSPGKHVYQQPIPPASISGGDVSLRFELDQALLASDGRELGVQVVFWCYDNPEPQALRPITLS